MPAAKPSKDQLPWAALTLVVALIFLTVALVVGWNDYADHHHVSDSELLKVCRTYAELDLSQAAGVCHEVGYQDGP